MLLSNYPDDIRNYDNTPGSPYYNPPWEECTKEGCSAIGDPDDYDENGRCSEDCAVVFCEICDDDIENCGGCENE